MSKCLRRLHQRFTQANLAFVIASLPLLGLLGGCGTVTSSLPASPVLYLSSTSLSVPVGNRVRFHAYGPASADGCSWSSSLPSILSSAGDGIFQARSGGTAQIVVDCGKQSATALVVVTPTADPITITQGGTYSGNWTSNDPQTAAVTIQTDDPVILRNSTIASRGDLIAIQGVSRGANVTVKNVTGTGLDPEIAGLQRGSFVTAQKIASLSVHHCTMTGVRFGVKVLSSTASRMSIRKNIATELEDRESDGKGGFLTLRPDLGHFVMLNGVSAPGGAEISWNQVVDTLGQSSTEDVINIYKSQGAPGAPISVHDNYLEGYSSPATSSYTGAGLITDGDSNEPVTAFVTFIANQIVHAAGSGIEIAAGHDILARKNRVVSCGIDPEGNWYAAPFVNAAVMWNFYGAPNFNNNRIDSTSGGMLRPSLTNQPEIADAWVRLADLNASDIVESDGFTDPCIVGGRIDLTAEESERAYWKSKLAQANITPGDHHTF